MSDNPATQSNGTDLTTPTETPSGGGEATTSSQTESPKDYEEWKSRATKAEETVKKVQDLYGAYPNAVQLVKSYVEDAKARQDLDSYLTQGVVPAKETERSTDSMDLDGLDDTTKKSIDAYISTKLQEQAQGFEQKFNTLNQARLQDQIEGWRKKYTVENGFPVNFAEVESDLAQMLNEGKATDAVGAYKIYCTDKFLEKQTETNKQLREAKIKASMSRASLPTTLKVRKGDDRKGIESAFQEAFEELGMS